MRLLIQFRQFFRLGPRSDEVVMFLALTKIANKSYVVLQKPESPALQTV